MTPEDNPMEAWLTERAKRAKRWVPLAGALYVLVGTLILCSLLNIPDGATWAAGLLAAVIVATVLVDRRRRRVDPDQAGQ